MGYKLTKFNFVPGENEQIDAVIRVPKEPRSVINGVVLDEYNKPLVDAVVKLYRQRKAEDTKLLEPVTHTFTDEHGNFIFGPLCPNVKYVIKVWVNHVKFREIVIKPEPCEVKCEKDKRTGSRDRKDSEEYEEYSDNKNDRFDDEFDDE